MNIPSLTATLEEVKKFIRENWKNAGGVRCPACDQTVKLYKRPMHATMGRMLIELYWLDRHDRQGFFHVTEIGRKISSTVSSAGDFAKLRYWGLIEEQEKDPLDTAKRTSGMWRITDAGVAFVEGRMTVQSHVLIYDSRFLGLTGDQVGVRDVLGKNFNYEDLMANIS